MALTRLVPTEPASADIDAELAQRDRLAVDALVGIAGDEQVVVGVRGEDAQEAPLLGIDVLRLIDDDGR